MDVKTLCLGLLGNRPASGYDLKKEFESLFKHFFPAGYGSIYPALADLAASGYVSCEAIPQDGKPDRKVYSVTAAGREAFARALRKSKPQHKLRSEFLATIYFADAMEQDRLEELLDERLAELGRTLEHIRGIKDRSEGELSNGMRFVAGFGEALASTAAEYIEANRNLLLNSSAAPTRTSKTTSTNSKTNRIENRV